MSSMYLTNNFFFLEKNVFKVELKIVLHSSFLLDLNNFEMDCETPSNYASVNWWEASKAIEVAAHILKL